MCIVSVKTMTAAIKARKALSGAGIESEILSLDRTLTKNGCAYGLGYPCAESRQVERILKMSKVSYGEFIGRRGE